MKNGLVCTVFTFITFGFFSQEIDLTKAEKDIEQIENKNEFGYIIDAYYGDPIERFTSDVSYSDSYSFSGNSISYVDSTSYNKGLVLGARLELKPTKRIGIGLDINYLQYSTNNTFTEIDNINNEVAYNSISRINYDIINSQLRLNYYFISRPKFSLFSGIGAGISNKRRTINCIGCYKEYFFKIFGPYFLARIAAGSRYYFTDNIGLNIEIGLGRSYNGFNDLLNNNGIWLGHVISAGLSIKL